MPSNTDWGKGGSEGFIRDPGNEQITPLAAGAKFTGQWKRVDNAESFLILYGTHVPFTMQIQWSADGVTKDLDPFATITPQVRNKLGLYSVISPQSTYFRPYYRIEITNGASNQLFVVSDSILLKTVFPGYDISVDGPIPVLGLAKLTAGLNWGQMPTGSVQSWEPIQLTANKNQKICLAENLLGNLPVTISNFPPQAPIALDAATLAALETVNSIVSGNVSISNFPVNQPVIVGNFPLNQQVTVSNFPTPIVNVPNQKFFGVGTGLPQVIKIGPGTLKSVVLSGSPTFQAFADLLGVANKFIDVSATENYLGPLDIPFTVGLTVKVQTGKPFTVVFT